jgi:MYXO-CTERM domain-containing protein
MSRLKNLLPRTLFAFALFLTALTPPARAVVNVVSGGDAGEGYAPDYHGTVYAYHLTSGTQTQATDVVQGVSFLPWNAGAAVPHVAASTVAPYPSGAASFAGPLTANDTALQDISTAFWYRGTDPLTITFNDLQVGKSYQLDLFWFWAGGGTWPDYYKITDATGVQAIVETVPGVSPMMYDVRDTVVAADDGFGNGRVILDAYKAPGNTDAPYITAFSITGPLPEPTGAAALLGLAVLGLVRRRRHWRG